MSEYIRPCDTCGAKGGTGRPREYGQVTCDSCDGLWWGMTLRNGTYVTAKMARARLLAELRRWNFSPKLTSSEQRIAAADRIMSDAAANARRRGE